MRIFKLLNLIILCVMLLNIIIPVISIATDEINEKEVLTENQIGENTTIENISDDNNVVNEEKNEDEIEEKIEEQIEEQSEKINIEEPDTSELIEEKPLTIEETNVIDETVTTDIEINKLTAIKKEITEDTVFDNIETNSLTVAYGVNGDKSGWQEAVKDGEVAGKIEEDSKISDIKIKLYNAPENAQVRYRIYVAEKGWQDIACNGEKAGIVDENLKISGIKVDLKNMNAYSIQYKVYSQENGWGEWKVDAQIAGDIYNDRPIQAIQIRIVSKIDKEMSLKYCAKVKDVGWQEVEDGQMAGTVGQAKAIQGIRISLNSSNLDSYVQYRAYINGKWQSWKNDSEIAQYQENNLEAIQIKLINLNEYNIKYRAHVSNVGWQSWVNNGTMAGKIGEHIEAIQIEIAKKDDVELAVAYDSHVQDYGWEKSFSKRNGQTSGTTGKNKKIEAIHIKINNGPDNMGIKYTTYVEKLGWQKWVSNGEMSGTTGENKKVYGLKIELENTEEYSVKYRVHIQDIGWQEWKYDGKIAGEIDKNKKIEAIEIQLTPKQVEQSLSVKYRSHVQDIGWQSYVKNGEVSGTIGHNKKIEAMNIELVGATKDSKIRYKTYIEGTGWQDWKENGALAGTTGLNKKMYGIKIELVNMKDYSVQYRVHIENQGWSSWKIDGNTAGNVGDALKIEAIQIRIIQKTNSYDLGVEYYSYLNGKGWEEAYGISNGELSGTVGQNRKMEGIKIRLKNASESAHIKYRTHVQDYGWRSYVKDGALSGVLFEGKKIEAIQISLEGMDNYTVEYKVHVQDIGWTDWYIDGEVAGTTGQNKKIEAIQIRLVPKYKRIYKGIDVSQWNGTIKWNQVKASGVDFAILRIGYRGYGEAGNIVEDPYFKANLTGAKTVGLKVGVYFFTQAKTVAEAVQEANWTIDKLKGYGYKLDLPIAIDTEDSSEPNGNGRADHLDKQTRTAVVKAFCEKVKSNGYTPMIYASKNWFYDNLDISQLSKYDTWLAHYTSKTDYKYHYEIWQYSSTGSVLGILGNTDMNYGYKKYW